MCGGNGEIYQRKLYLDSIDIIDSLSYENVDNMIFPTPEIE